MPRPPVSLEAVRAWLDSREEVERPEASRMRVAVERAESVLDPHHRSLESLRPPMLGAVLRALARHFAESTVRGYGRLLERVVTEYEDSHRGT